MFTKSRSPTQSSHGLLMQIAQIAFENYRARLNRLFDEESDDLYRAE